VSYALFQSEFTVSSICLLHCCIVTYLFPYADTDEGPRIILAPNIENVNNVVAPQGDAGAVVAAQGDLVAGDAAEGAAVAGDSGVAVVGDAAEGDAIAANPDEGVDEDAYQVVVNSRPTWFLASNSYHYGNFDLLLIQIHGDRHSNAPT
jgi:hypothetical protein